MSSLRERCEKSKLGASLLILLAVVFSQEIKANENILKFKVERTRVYVNGDEKKGFFNVINEGDTPLIVSAALFNVASDGGQGERSRDFLVSPPYFYMAPKKSRVISVVRFSEKFPLDEESLRYLRLHVLPSTEKDVNKPVMISSTMMLYVSLFYRPNLLVDKYAVSKVCPKITAQLIGNEIEIHNPSPYWLIVPKIESEGIAYVSENRSPRIAPWGKLTIPALGNDVLNINCIQETGMPVESTIQITKDWNN